MEGGAPSSPQRRPAPCPDGWWEHIEAAGTGEAVVKYLARYVQHTAISDEHILATGDAHVQFSYTDSRVPQRSEEQTAAFQ